MEIVYVLYLLNEYGEEIDSCPKEFKTYDEAESYLYGNPLMFDLKNEVWEIVECKRIPVATGMKWGRGGIIQ